MSLGKDKVVKLIKGRIEDEYRKHPTLDWAQISASKIYSQWFEYFNNENKDLKSQLILAEQTVKLNYNNAIDFEKQLSVEKQQNEMLIAVINNLKKECCWINIKDNLPIAYKTGNWDGKMSDTCLGKFEDGSLVLFKIYKGFLDGSEFLDYFDDNDFEIDAPLQWKQID